MEPLNVNTSAASGGTRAGSQLNDAPPDSSPAQRAANAVDRLDELIMALDRLHGDISGHGTCEPAAQASQVWTPCLQELLAVAPERIHNTIGEAHKLIISIREAIL